MRFNFRTIACYLLAAALAGAVNAAGQSKAPRQLPPDDRYKADLLLIVAHPDDDVVIGGFLAKVAFDDRKRIAVIYCTSGDGGGNAVGNEAGASLGQIRTIEARRAMRFFGIDNVWFLGAHDTPGQDVLRSLDAWGHGHMLDEMVRLVRITRPEVVMTWMPNYVVGENHGDHQASGVIATEAFDAAGDPTQFPEQVSPPRNRVGMQNLTEGLYTWQPKKLYYFTDAFEDFGPYWHSKEDLSPFRPNFLTGHGPSYDTKAISPSKKESYAKLTVEHQLFYQTQEADLGKEALGSAGMSGFEYPVQLLFGKSMVGGSVTGDVFENLSAAPVPFARTPGYQSLPAPDLSLDLGGPWTYYRQFWKAHGIENIGNLIPVPELAVESRQSLSIPLIVRNATQEARDVRLVAKLPDGWMDKTQYQDFPVGPNESYALRAELIAPPSAKSHWQEIVFTAASAGKPIGSVTLRVYAGKSGGLPQ